MQDLLTDCIGNSIPQNAKRQMLLAGDLRRLAQIGNRPFTAEAQRTQRNNLICLSEEDDKQKLVYCGQ